MSNSDERVLRKVVQEARERLHGGARDWDKLDAKLFARIEADKTAQASLDRFAGRRTAWSLAACGLAAAAALAVFVGRPATSERVISDPSSQGASETLAAATPNASALVLRKGSGDVTVRTKTGAGSALASGQSVCAGDIVDTRGATAFFERRLGVTLQAGHAVTWTLEDASQITVEKAGASLVLGLLRGAIEAQVTSVATGEAFAVDVASVSDQGLRKVTRIAVHGTHLRVGRVGSTRVLIDLTEGVVSIGTPPRVGSTYGTLVTAPAHVEFDLRTPNDIQVSHTASAVRPALDLALAIAGPNTAQTAAPRIAMQSPSPTSPLPAGHVPPSAVPTPKAKEPAPAVASPDPNAEATIAAAVRACAATRPRSVDVKVTVSSTLELRVNADGNVEFARFDPPLVPEVQTCAATSIYKTRFKGEGTVSIPIELE